MDIIETTDFLSRISLAFLCPPYVIVKCLAFLELFGSSFAYEACYPMYFHGFTQSLRHAGKVP